MEKLAYCGLNCTVCPLYIITKEDDREAMEKLASEYSTDTCAFEPSDMICDGCHTEMAGKGKMCGDCSIRQCGVTRSVANCGECAEYPCGIISKMLPDDSENRLRLDEIAKGAGAGLS